jgi:hypothetical protein
VLPLLANRCWFNKRLRVCRASTQLVIRGDSYTADATSRQKCWKWECFFVSSNILPKKEIKESYYALKRKKHTPLLFLPRSIILRWNYLWVDDAEDDRFILFLDYVSFSKKRVDWMPHKQWHKWKKIEGKKSIEQYNNQRGKRAIITQ